MTTEVPAQRRFPTQWAAVIFGVAFLTVGVLGFIPGATADVASIRFAGHGSSALLLGLFQVSVLLNIVHLLFGLLGVVMMRRRIWSFHYLLWGGLIYALLGIYGLVISPESTANFVPFNTPDNWLHFGLAVVMVGAAFILRRRVSAARTQGPYR